MGNLKKAVATFAKAQCSAWVASAVDFGVTLTLASIFGLWYGYATLIGAFTGGLVNCGINYRWVFHAFGMKKKYVALRYVFVWTGSIALNTWGTWRLTELTGINYIISKTIVAVLVAVLWNYQLQRTFVFHYGKQKVGEQS
mgnify:CR=1 FL=1